MSELIERHRPAFCYTIPTFHNPTGITQSAQRRARLVALARETGCPVVADEVYQYLYYNQPGRQFSASPEQASAMRLCFAFYDAHSLEQACTRLSLL